MTNPNGRKGAETERMVAKYFREQGFWMTDRRLREGRTDDQGDLDGVPFTTVQVKYVAANRYQDWITDTLKQRDTAGTPLCLLVRRVPRKPVEQWEALMPSSYFVASYEDTAGPIEGQPPESEAWTWVRMDLRFAVVALQRMINALRILSVRSSSTTEYRPSEIKAWPSVQSTEKGTPPSPTI